MSASLYEFSRPSQEELPRLRGMLASADRQIVDLERIVAEDENLSPNDLTRLLGKLAVMRGSVERLRVRLSAPSHTGH